MVLSKAQSELKSETEWLQSLENEVSTRIRAQLDYHTAVLARGVTYSSMPSKVEGLTADPQEYIEVLRLLREASASGR